MQLKSKLTVITSCDNRVAAHEYGENARKRKKERGLIAAFHAASLLHLRRYQILVKIELNLFYPKFSLNFLKFYFVKFCLFKADICLYRIFTIGI